MIKAVFGIAAVVLISLKELLQSKSRNKVMIIYFTIIFFVIILVILIKLEISPSVYIMDKLKELGIGE